MSRIDLALEGTKDFVNTRRLQETATKVGDGESFRAALRSTTETLDNSTAAKLRAQQQFGDELGAAVANLREADVKRLQTGYEEKLTAFRQEVGNLFRSEEISVDPMPEFRLNPQGKLELVGNHSDKLRIENALRKRPDLADAFSAMLSDKTQLDLIASARKRDAAVPQFAVLFDGARTLLGVEKAATPKSAGQSAASPAAAAAAIKAGADRGAASGSDTSGSAPLQPGSSLSKTV